MHEVEEDDRLWENIRNWSAARVTALGVKSDGGSGVGGDARRVGRTLGTCAGRVIIENLPIGQTRVTGMGAKREARLLLLGMR